MRIIKRETYRFLKTLSYSLEQVFIELIKTPHILGICGIGMKIESLPKFNLRFFFLISLHQGMPSYSLFPKYKCSMLSHMNKVNPFISTACFCMRHKIIYSNNWYQSGLQSHVCITCWVSFRIIENSFHGFENSAVIFLHSLISKLSLMKLKLMLWCCFSLMLSMPNWTLRL